MPTHYHTTTLYYVLTFYICGMPEQLHQITRTGRANATRSSATLRAGVKDNLPRAEPAGIPRRTAAPHATCYAPRLHRAARRAAAFCTTATCQAASAQRTAHAAAHFAAHQRCCFTRLLPRCAFRLHTILYAMVRFIFAGSMVWAVAGDVAFRLAEKAVAFSAPGVLLRAAVHWAWASGRALA